MNIHDINFAAESLANRCDPAKPREAAFAAMLRKSIRRADIERDGETIRLPERWVQLLAVPRNFANDPTL